MTRYFHPAAANELQIDIDNGRSFKQFKAMLKVLKQARHLEVRGVKRTNSQTKGHYHISILFKDPLPVMERIALQVVLGDDPLRALMNWGRVRNNDPFPILFIDSRKSWMIPCHCKNIDRLPRCSCLRQIQSSRAEFPANTLNESS